MKRIFACGILALWPLDALAEGFCGVTNLAEITARIAGAWQREGTASIVNETTDVVRPSADYVTDFMANGQIANAFFDGVTGEALPAELKDPRPYDVDLVDDMLDTTGRADLADDLSDTLCGPEQLPQLSVTLNLADAGDFQVIGTVTYIPYFDDRILEIGRLELKSDETILFMTETALLRPKAQ
ncbi:hypothetical protein [Pacificoceanicola onchidii]|uniref:hypothetical protein n=1 Tax=Pacificoceanicola onchidii TaxID=2562685 RepID=UPI0010A59B75|nr:hypothetical protein [Pacificoceanicola onchidii]